jgi:hypothetical protein
MTFRGERNLRKLSRRDERKVGQLLNDGSDLRGGFEGVEDGRTSSARPESIHFYF